MPTLDQRLNAQEKRTRIAELKHQEIAAKAATKHQLSANANLNATRLRPSGPSYPQSAGTDITRHDREKAMSMARKKYADSPIVAAMVQTLSDNIVGTGLELVMKTNDADYNREVQARWDMAKDQLDVRGIRAWGDLNGLWYRRHYIDGDVLVNLLDGGKAKDSDGNEVEGSATRSLVQTIEADRCYQQEVVSGDSGIEYDAVGRPYRYWIGGYDPGTQARDTNPKPHDARHIVYYANFPQDRADRQRGVSQMVQSFNMLTDIEQILEAMLQKVKDEAFMGLMFKTEGPASVDPFGSAATTDNVTIEDGTQRKAVKMVPGLNLNMRPNETAEMLESKTPGGEWVPYIRFMCRLLGAAQGVPLEMFLMDFAETNFSGSRVLVELAKRRFGVEQRKLARVCSRIFQWWLAREIKYNGLQKPNEPTGGIDGERKALAPREWAHEWIMPGFPYIDPLKETQAKIAAVNAGMDTLTNVIGKRGDGRDFDSVAMERKQELDRLAELGVPVTAGMPGQVVINPDEDDTDVSEDGDGDNDTED